MYSPAEQRNTPLIAGNVKGKIDPGVKISTPGQNFTVYMTIIF